MIQRNLLRRVADLLPSMVVPRARAYRFVDGDGKCVQIQLQSPLPFENGTSSFLIGTAKGGSTLLNRMAADILREVGRFPINLPTKLFAEGVVIDRVVSDKDGALEIRGVVYAGFRGIPDLLLRSANFAQSNRLLLVRDPRDILVSLYFSQAYSHRIPESGEGKRMWDDVRSVALSEDIDASVLRNAAKVLSQLLAMGEFLDDQRTTLLRYEDIIFDKLKLARAICDTIGISIAPQVLERISTKHDIFPKSEDQFSHVRNVTPGDHRNKLKLETITRLNEILHPALSKFWPEESLDTNQPHQSN